MEGGSCNNSMYFYQSKRPRCRWAAPRAYVSRKEIKVRSSSSVAITGNTMTLTESYYLAMNVNPLALNNCGWLFRDLILQFEFIQSLNDLVMQVYWLLRKLIVFRTRFYSWYIFECLDVNDGFGSCFSAGYFPSIYETHSGFMHSCTSALGVWVRWEIGGTEM